MPQVGAVSIKDEKQEKDGDTTGLLRASPRKDDTQKQTGDTAKLLRDDIRRTQDNEEKDLNKRSLCVLSSIFSLILSFMGLLSVVAEKLY